MGQITEAKTEEDQNKMKLWMSRKELVAMEKRERACREEGQRKLGRVRAEVEEMRARLGKIGWSEEREGKRRLVGECYIHGVMKGEGIWLPGVGERTFCLH